MRYTLLFTAISALYACGEPQNSNLSDSSLDTQVQGETVTSHMDAGPTDMDGINSNHDSTSETTAPSDATSEALDATRAPADVGTEDVSEVSILDQAGPSDVDAGIENPSGDDDNDGLSNGEEAVHGTDPQNADSDGDGYLDGHEITEGKDPLDPESRIYTGMWPYNPGKDLIESPGWDKCSDGECIGFGSCDPADANKEGSDWQEPTGCSLKNGLKLPRWIAKDQYGDMVDLYDFIGTGKPVVLDVATPYCKPCKALAAYFATGDPNHTTVHSPDPLTSFAWWKPEYEVLLEMIDQEEIHWITVIWSSCVGGNPVDENAGGAWHDEWPHSKIPALVDPNCQLKDYLNVKAMPHLDVLDSDLVFTTYATNGPVAAIKALLEL